MARKSRKAEQLKQEIVNSVPIEQRKIITQPIAFNYLNGEMTTLQTRIQTMIMESLQDRIKMAISSRNQGFAGNLFSDADFAPITPNGKTKYLTFEVRYSELNIEPSHYEDVDKAAEAMQSLIYKKEVKDENGRPATNYNTVFSTVTIPDKKERRDSIKLRMLPETAHDLFKLIPYQRYFKDIVFLFSSNYAGRIYLLINAYKKYGTWKMSYEKLRRILLTSYDRYTKKITVDKYRNISDFKKRVLETARQEILEVADRVDCTFDYEFIYPNGKKRGTPEYILFHIHTTDLGKSINQKKLENKEQEFVDAEEIREVENVKKVKKTVKAKPRKESELMKEW